MDKMHFCTIITPDYIDYVKVQYHFLKQFDENVEIYVLVSTTEPADIQTASYKNLPEAIKCIIVSDICNKGIGKSIFEKYYHSFIDSFRWSMKPVLLNFLFEKNIADKIVYIDWDIMFFSDYKFLFDDLDQKDVLLIPHWFSMKPGISGTDREDDFERNFKQGLFQAGFFAANKNAVDLIKWWAEACLYVCEVDKSKGYFVDQSHLNLFPLMSEKVEIVQHKGCNIAEWNRIECVRVKAGTETLINGHFPIVFIHFTNYTVRDILDGADELLRPYFDAYSEKYKEVTTKILPGILNHQAAKEFKERKITFSEKAVERLSFFKNSIRLRTRFIKFLEG